MREEPPIAPYRESRHVWPQEERPTCRRCKRMLGPGRRRCLSCAERVDRERLVVDGSILAVIAVMVIAIFLAFQIVTDYPR